jgi:hypothetical protein
MRACAKEEKKRKEKIVTNQQNKSTNFRKC